MGMGSSQNPREIRNPRFWLTGDASLAQAETRAQGHLPLDGSLTNVQVSDRLKLAPSALRTCRKCLRKAQGGKTWYAQKTLGSSDPPDRNSGWSVLVHACSSWIKTTQWIWPWEYHSVPGGIAMICHWRLITRKCRFLDVIFEFSRIKIA